jgi:uroporphyrinogen-III synthase
MSMRVMITRELAQPMQGMLEALGLAAVHVPLVVLSPTGQAAPEVPAEQVVLTSAAVVRFVPDLAECLGAVPIAAVGDATAGALRSIELRPEWIGSSGGEALVDGLRSRSRHLWYIGAVEPSDGVRRALAAYPGRVSRWAVYDNRLPADAAARLAEAGAVDLVTLTSPSAARRYAELGGVVPVAVIGDSTAQAARAVGLEIRVQAAQPRVDALAEAVRLLLLSP